MSGCKKRNKTNTKGEVKSKHLVGGTCPVNSCQFAGKRKPAPTDRGWGTLALFQVTYLAPAKASAVVGRCVRRIFRINSVDPAARKQPGWGDGSKLRQDLVFQCKCRRSWSE